MPFHIVLGLKVAKRGELQQESRSAEVKVLYGGGLGSLYDIIKLLQFDQKRSKEYGT